MLIIPVFHTEDVSSNLTRGTKGPNEIGYLKYT